MNKDKITCSYCNRYAEYNADYIGMDKTIEIRACGQHLEIAVNDQRIAERLDGMRSRCNYFGKNIALTNPSP